MTYSDAELEKLRDWWDGLREIEQFGAYVVEKSNAESLLAGERAADREITRLRQDNERLRAAIARLDRRTSRLTVQFTGGTAWVRTRTSWIEELVDGAKR
jgi:hypothetical protein